MPATTRDGILKVTKKSFRKVPPARHHGTNGPQVHRLLPRLTEFLEIQSGDAARYPEYTEPSARKSGYQIEHIWADRPERYEDEFAHLADFTAYRNRVGGLVLLPAGDNTSAHCAFPLPGFSASLIFSTTLR